MNFGKLSQSSFAFTRHLHDNTPAIGFINNSV